MPVNSTTPSRLSLSTAGLRNELESRNLYTPNSEYPLQSSQNTAKVVSTVNTIIGAITPFKSYNLENTVYGRLIQSNANTPLATIGLAMLGKQMALNMMSNASQQLFPVIKVNNLFDGNPSTNLFTPHQDFGITKIEQQTDLNNFVRRIVGTKNPSLDPFNETSNNANYLENTGKGQLVFLLDQLNKNVYKSDDTALNQIGIDINNPIQPRGNLVNNSDISSINYTTFFNFGDGTQYPYSHYYPKNPLSDSGANNAMIAAVNNNAITAYGNLGVNGGDAVSQEYAPNQIFIDNLGTTLKTQNTKNQSLNNESGLYEGWIGSTTEFMNDGNFNKLIWGKSGIDADTAGILGEFRGTFGSVNVVEDTNFNTDFNVKGAGLLEYTRNLIRATEGQIGDITRKAFVKGSEIIGFNGSPLWKANTSTYALSSKSGQAGKTGVRQHSALDQYDRFAKAIRFDGNNVYGGNENSVIYKTVLPRIHPTLRKSKDYNEVADNKNLMLSIENLAIKVISKNNVGIIDDEYGSEIPACEVGPFNGRIMWFPPYAMEINETATAKYEPTVMVGRNEPMYNYQNSERSATLNFTLLVDYPPNVRNYNGSSNSQKDIADFFAFGGDAVKGDSYVKNLEKRKRDLEDRKLEINYKFVPDMFDTPTIPAEMMTYFPNDMPKDLEVDKIFDTIYKEGYEINVRFKNNYDARNLGLNQGIYINANEFEEYEDQGMYFYAFLPNEPNFSQYTNVDEIDSYGGGGLNSMLKEFFDNKDLWQYYEINVVGHCSSPAPTDYNVKLGQRRADATKTLIRSKLDTLYGGNTNAIVINTGTLGETGTGDLDGDVSSDAAKKNRYAKISIRRNSKKYVNPNAPKPTQTDAELIKKIDDEIETIDKNIKKSKFIDTTNVAVNCVMNERLEDKSAILHGFNSITNNYYYPIFHSQTPEDFHKRLTFLQQCTRQGAAKHYSSVIQEGILRAKNSVFGRQPICILRVGDFFYTKVIIESVNIDYSDTTWDMNPEGFGMQPMLAKVTLNMKVIGGQSLKGPIDALQNAVSFNYYANSTFTSKGMYILPSAMASMQSSYKAGVEIQGGNNYNDTLTDSDRADNLAVVERFKLRNELYKKSE